MKYNNTLSLLTTVAEAIKDPTVITDKLGITEMFQFPNSKSVNSSVPVGKENTTKKSNKDTPILNSKGTNNTSREKNTSYDNRKDASDNPQGLIDSIAQDLTSARLQQAIILSEIVGKPRSKTRKKRRF